MPPQTQPGLMSSRAVGQERAAARQQPERPALGRQALRHALEALRLLGGKAMLDNNVLALDVAHIGKPLPKRGQIDQILLRHFPHAKACQFEAFA